MRRYSNSPLQVHPEILRTGIPTSSRHPDSSNDTADYGVKPKATSEAGSKGVLITTLSLILGLLAIGIGFASFFICTKGKRRAAVNNVDAEERELIQILNNEVAKGKKKENNVINALNLHKADEISFQVEEQTDSLPPDLRLQNLKPSPAIENEETAPKTVQRM